MCKAFFCTHLKQFENQAKKDYCPIKRNVMEIKCLSHGKKKKKTKILNKPTIVNALGTEVLLDMFCIGPFPFPLPFQNLNGFLCKI